MDIVGKIHTPEDPEWAVWADALLARGDPRGELIALERLSEAELRPDQIERLEALRQPYIERFKANVRIPLDLGSRSDRDLGTQSDALVRDRSEATA